ncbi:CPBP family intramembrane glutamic endopeptidase [Frondihabitans sucicola]|nr:CPBP family intramembrane glutamic endopeptidase [Frondihabitans sucicola]
MVVQPVLRGTGARRSWRSVLVIAAAGIAVAFPVSVWVALVVIALVIAAGFVASRNHDVAFVDAAVAVALLWLLIRLPVVGIWPVSPGLAILGAFLFAITQHRVRGWHAWFRIGHIDAVSWLVIVGVVVITVASLVTWESLTGGTLPAAYEDSIGSVPAPLAVALVVVFLVLNGAVEDTLWSGLLLSASKLTLPAAVAVVLTSASFAAAHLHGVPSGPIGVGMVLLWGLALSYLRIRTHGMLATYLAHVAADVTIAVVLGAFSSR